MNKLLMNVFRSKYDTYSDIHDISLLLKLSLGNTILLEKNF